MKLKDQVAFITGGSSGIGRATAELFGREGAKVVVISGSDLSRAQAVVDEINTGGGSAMALRADVRSPGDLGRAVAEAEAIFGPIDILVNCAGVYLPTRLGETSEEDFDLMVDTNLKGTFFATQAVATGMKARRRGRIVNIASVAAYKGSASYPLYSAVKAGIVMLTRGFALDLAPHDVAINAIAPGNTETPINAVDRASAQIKAGKRATTPSTRVYSPASEMAEAILFLSDGRVKAMHGSTLLLDEGISA